MIDFSMHPFTPIDYTIGYNFQHLMSLEKPGSMMGQSSTCSNLHPLQPVYNLFDS